MNLSQFSSFRHRDFALLWVGQCISMIGTEMQMVAMNWHVYILTHSAIALGLIGFFRFMPLILFSLLSGSFSDTHNRKHILMISQITFLILSAILGILTLSHNINTFEIFIIASLLSITSSFDIPARQALLPNLIPTQDLSQAMSLYSIVRQVALIIGPALGGFAIVGIGLGNIYLVNAFSFFAIIIALLFMQTSGEVTGIVSTVSFSSVMEGLSFVRSKSIIWSTMVLDFFSNFFASAQSLIPLFTDILHVGPQGLGFLYAAPSVGAIVAGISMTYIGHLKKPGKFIIWSVCLYAIGTILFGVSRIFLFSLFALMLVGAGDSISTIVRNTIRQLATPDHLKGRMTAINMIFFMGGPQLGDFEAGILAAAVGGPLSVIIGGVGTLIALGCIAYFMPVIREYQQDITSPVLG